MLGAALEPAARLVGEILRDKGDEFRAKLDLTVTVTDPNDLTLWTVNVAGTEAPRVSVARPRSR